ncbi:cell surface glycoprotein CD200 receptor 1-A [Lampris incognitus]|uniref:cell surface glycoprotein CD200 receptor 1-A n=1 Tax=Lampris incognitus TaxID=2546036 RepID=UPI0024B5CFDC|nr:cell surface glycoprotein CD200 receptor 1-A [Lampris incognitus]
MAWALGVISLLVLSETWSLDSETNRNTSVISNATLYTSPATKDIPVDVSKNKIVNLGSDVSLQCTNKTWNEIIYTIWKIHLKGRQCQLGFSDEGQSHNLCNDRKSLQNTSSSQSYLLIREFSKSDEGIYNCELSYKGGSFSAKFNVSVTVPPRLWAKVEWRGSRRVAVCSATDGKPAASIIWRNAENVSSVPEVTSSSQPDGSYSVTSELDLPQGVAADNLTCAVSHFSWGGEKMVIPERAFGGPTEILLVSLIAAGLVLAIFLGLSCFAVRKRIMNRHYCRSDAAPSQQSKPLPMDVEEVEPYASYVQRVNCIYNSSLELFR